MKRYILTLAVIMSVITACENDLDLLPKDTLVRESFFKSSNDFNLYANYAYNQLPDFGKCSRDNDADIAYAGSSISNGTYIEAQANGLWNWTYSNVRRHNNLLAVYDKLEEGELKESVEVYVAEAKFFRALNYYNLLLDFGGVPIIKIPLGVEDEQLYAPRNTFFEVVDFILEDLDAAIAFNKLGTATGPTSEGRVSQFAAIAFKSRVCLFAGTWAKYHQNSGDASDYLTKAKLAAKNVMDNGNYELFKKDDQLNGLDESYRHLFILETETQSNIANLGKNDQKEYILVRKFDRLNQRTGYISLRSGNLSPTKKMADLFLDNTGLPIMHGESIFEGHGFTIDPVTKVVNNIEFNNRDPRMAANFIQPFEQFFYHTPYHRDFALESQIGKGAWNEGMWTSNTGYLLHKFCPETEGGGLAIDFPVIRYAEVLLNYAEATYEIDDQISNADLNISINLLRERVGMPSLTNEFVSGNSLDMQNEIRRERTVELCFEGFRYDDLRRWKTAEIEIPVDMKGVQWTNSLFPTEFEVYNEQEGAVVTVTSHVNATPNVDGNGFILRETVADRTFDTGKHYLKPLPLRQLKINENLEQNPGWAKQ